MTPIITSLYIAWSVVAVIAFILVALGVLYGIACVIKFPWGTQYPISRKWLIVWVGCSLVLAMSYDLHRQYERYTSVTYIAEELK